MSLTATPRPHLTLRPPSGWSAINVRELWQFRDLLFALAGRDLRLRYKQTALGIIWVVLQPLMAAGIFSFVFGTVAHLDTSFISCFAGMLAWNMFANTLTKVSNCLVGNSQLISKVFFPRLILPLSIVPSVLVDTAIAMVMMAALLVMNHVHPTMTIFLLPVWMLILMLMSLGAGVLSASLMVSYRDVQYILPVAVNILLYASPIAYPLSAVPARLMPFFMINPLTGPLEAFRWSLLNNPAPPTMALAYSAVLAVVLFLAGAFGFKRMERKFADVI